MIEGAVKHKMEELPGITAAALQHRPAAIVPRLQTTRPKSHLTRSVHAALLWGGGSMNAAALKPPG